VRDNFAGEGADGDASTFPGGASLRSADGRRGWVLADEHAHRALGAALIWARQFDIAELHVLVDDADAPGALARRAGEFLAPPVVWQVVGREIVAVEPTAAAGAGAGTGAGAGAGAGTEAGAEAGTEAGADESFVSMLASAGAEPVVEHGALVGEVLGLEVARVVDGQLEVGVGKHDREAQKLMHADRPTYESLVAAVAAVRAVRFAGAQPHQMNQLAAERWLRAVVCARPALVGAASLRPVSSTVPRPDLRISAPAPALGEDADGQPVVVVCSVGIDVDLVPVAADARLVHSPEARLVLVVPEVDAHPVTYSLAAALRRPAEVVTVPADWRSLTPPAPAAEL